MHKATLLCLLLPLVCVALDPQPLPADAAPATAVRIYPGWAEVERTVTIPAGPARRLRLTDLEQLLIPQTLRGSGPVFVAAQATIAATDLTEVAALTDAQSALAAASTALSQAQAAMTLIDQADINLQALLDAKTAADIKPGEQAPRTLASAEVEAVIRLNQALADNLAARIKQQPVVEAAQNKVKEAQKAYDTLLQNLRKTVGRIDLDVSASEAPATVRLVYAVAGASWTPTAAATVKDDTVTLNYQAVIRQSSSADWRDAVITLEHGQSIPAWLHPCLETGKKGGSGLIQLEETVLADIRQSQAILTDAIRIGIPSPWTSGQGNVLGNGTAAALKGPTFTLKAERTILLPANATQATIAYTVTNPNGFAYPAAQLAPGPFVEMDLPAFTGRSTITLHTQPDPLVSLTRTPMAAGGPIKGTTLTIANGHDTPVTVELYEAAGKLAVLVATPPAAVSGGLLHWTITVPAKASESVSWTWR